MIDFNLLLELMAVVATLVYMVLLISENFSEEESAVFTDQETNYIKKSLHGQRVAQR